MTMVFDETARIAVFGAGPALRSSRFGRLAFFAHRVVGLVDPRNRTLDQSAEDAGDGPFESAPCFASAAEVRERTGAGLAAVLSPPEEAGAVVLDCIAAGFALIVVFSEELFYQDRLEILAALEGRATRVIGPGSLGIVCPGRGQVGFLQSTMQSAGPVAILSRSAPLAYDAALQTAAQGLGQSCIVDLGIQPLDQQAMAAGLACLEEDRSTRAVVLIGAAGERVEEEAAAYLRSVVFGKPVVAYLPSTPDEDFSVWRGDPRVVRLGAGALARKAAALRAAGAVIAERPEEIGRIVARELARRRPERGRSLGHSDFALALRQVEESVYDVL